ncbi:uncharacterized protein LOC113226139 [Hyposmocoma kahamanoa]|uniref:uncharacterized protein LOC113226139 n=1 Tax=Hyposmocoma kahamanoa TaxID=1477025 RepID=UPI000E6D81D0|nr:uncharacterized protein LOC113226139 [Hyposmocoma kahamanoa]
MGEFNPKVRWVIPQRLDSMAFVGRDVLAVAHDIYIMFINMKTNTELVYVANSQKTGDGVDVIAGHRSFMFAFAEKVKHPRIFIMSYPTFTNLAELKDVDVNRYKGLCVLEGDLVAGFSGFPNYLVTVWSWRSCQRLICVPTGVRRRRQIYMPSRSHPLVCECWGEGLIVWEVTPCYKHTLMMKRAKEEVTGWEVSSPPLVGVCFTIDGALYAVDSKANLYAVTSDGINMVTNVVWEADIKGENTPHICAFGNGILLYGPDRNIRWLKKVENDWSIVWIRSLEGDKEVVKDEVAKKADGSKSKQSVKGGIKSTTIVEKATRESETFHRRRASEVALDVAERLLSSASAECAAMWTRAGRVLRLLAPASPDDNCPEVRLQAYKQRSIEKIQMIAPNFKHVVTMNDHGTLSVYEIMSAKLVLVKYVDGSEISFTASLVDPLLAVYGEALCGFNYGLTLLEWQEREEGRGDLVKVASVCLTHQSVSRVVFSPSGRELIAAAMSAGHIFLYKVSIAAYLGTTYLTHLMALVFSIYY